MKIVRWILGIFIVILAVLAIAVVLLVNFINPNDYRSEISTTISEKIHMPFAIHGDIKWLFFPELGFKVNDIDIGTPSQKALSAKLNRLEINLKLLPLLHKQIRIQALRLSGLQLVLPYQVAADADSANKTKKTEATAQSASQNALSGLAALPALNLDNLAIDNSQISQLGKNGKVAWSIRNFTFSGVNISLKNQFPIQTSFDFAYPEQQLSGKVDFKTYFGVQVNQQQMELTKPELTFSIAKAPSISTKGQLNLSEAGVDFAQHLIQLDQLKGNIGNLNLSSDRVTVNNFDRNPVVSGQLQSQSNNLKKALTDFGVKLPETQNANAFGNFALNTQFNYGNNQLALNPLTVKLDNNQLQGSVTSSDIQNLALNVKLNVPAITASDYLTKSETPKRIALNNLTVNTRILPPVGRDSTDWLASTLTGNINSQSIQFNDQKFDNVQLVFDGKNKVIHFNKLHANAFKGTLDATAQVNLQNNQPQFSVSPNFQNIQIAELLKNVESKLKLSGNANVSGTITTQGDNAKALNKNLNGNLKTHITNGVLHGINLDYWAGVASALYHRDMGSLPPQPKNATTEFSNIAATLNINQGVVSNKDLIIQAKFARATGQGTIDLNRELLNYHLQIVKMNQQTGKAHNDIVPLNITGSFDNPSVQPDMAIIAQQVVSKQVDKYKDKLAESISKKIGGGETGNDIGQAVGNALGNLLGGNK